VRSGQLFRSGTEESKDRGRKDGFDTSLPHVKCANRNFPEVDQLMVRLLRQDRLNPEGLRATDEKSAYYP
jgi:hypothetical protein